MPSILFDFFVNRHLFENRIVLLSFHPIGCVLFVLGGNVAGHAGHAAGFVLGAFQNDLNAITFFGHDGGVGSLNVQLVLRFRLRYGLWIENHE